MCKNILASIFKPQIDQAAGMSAQRASASPAASVSLFDGDTKAQLKSDTGMGVGDTQGTGVGLTATAKKKRTGVPGLGL